ncbi:MAG: hypothetical protein IJZ36_01335 [Bacilli bacterium]|nr:hypothetical protein [Bacilli bacterium]
MSKVVLNTLLVNGDFIKKSKINGIKNKNCILYIEDGIKTRITLSPIIKLERLSSEYNIVLYFDINSKTSGTYYLIGYNKYLDVEVITKNIINSDNYLYVEYELYIDKVLSGVFKFTLNY